MQQSTTRSIILLCIQLLQVVLASEAELTPEHCPRSPLQSEDRLTCDASWHEKKLENKPPRNPDAKSEWKGEKAEMWEGPFDCIDDYCIYLNRHLNGGLVLLSAEQNVHVIDAFPVPEPLEWDSPPFRVAEIPGKGIGLVANRTIREGEVVMRNTPALLVQFGPHLDFDGETRLAFYREAIGRLPRERQEAFMRQYGEDEFVKVDRNSFRLFINGEKSYSGHLGAYPDISRMNHDCRPNLHYRIENITHTSIAVRDIPAGEELTISYIDGHLSHRDRQERLDDWGFKCTCAQCSMSADEIAASDARMERIYAIEDELERMVGSAGPIEPALGEELVRLYEEERFLTYNGQALTRAALLHSLVGNAEKTAEYAARAFKAMRLQHGEHARDARAMAELLENPRGHWSWEARKPEPEKEAGEKVGWNF